ncbi:hypothetical protein V4Y02_24130, partial [Escherichia coli]
ETVFPKFHLSSDGLTHPHREAVWFRAKLWATELQQPDALGLLYSICQSFKNVREKMSFTWKTLMAIYTMAELIGDLKE